ncbi:hypothetical protein [Paenirhodobacter sp.]|uniref:hypothetical protein n=1 Tax=Paenirhodobacter sp. TaxID=1965326 RepID=UPI003B3F50F8
MSLIRNEQTKLTATYLNGVAIAVFAVGGLAPVFSSLYSGAGPSVFLLVVSVVCFLVSFALHYGARMALRRLEP